ncbi:GNAT family N-acetyltransferase [Glycomyces arizonensis]|uniref:GNAT family N-acetyltransferase n=1 Tax=Glycomyces arizonensis TaxID=256035 RepID=UPI0004059E6D|nr:N-acetyltransferase [Glycomyces arizonensis]
MTLIRRETESDRAAVHAVQDAAFATAQHASGHEADLVDALRGGEDWVPRLSLVAEVDGKIAGHVVCTHGRLAGERVLGLGPIGVEPALHGKGIGAALMHAVIGAADAVDEPGIVLLGDPKFYGRFGFVLAEELGVVPSDPNWAPYFQVRALANWGEELRGRFDFPPAFDEFG